MLASDHSPEELPDGLRADETSALRVSQLVAPFLETRRRAAARRSMRREYEQKVHGGEWPASETLAPLFPYRREGMLHLAFTERALLADELGPGKPGALCDAEPTSGCPHGSWTKQPIHTTCRPFLGLTLRVTRKGGSRQIFPKTISFVPIFTYKFAKTRRGKVPCRSLSPRHLESLALTDSPLSRARSSPMNLREKIPRVKPARKHMKTTRTILLRVIAASQVPSGTFPTNGRPQWTVVDASMTVIFATAAGAAVAMTSAFT